MSMAAVLTFDQYAAQNAELKAEFEAIKARIKARDESVERAMEISIELLCAGLLYQASGEVTNAYCCTYYICAITAMIEQVTPEAIQDRDQLTACTSQLVALNRRWAARLMQ